MSVAKSMQNNVCGFVCDAETLYGHWDIWRRFHAPCGVDPVVHAWAHRHWENIPLSDGRITTILANPSYLNTNTNTSTIHPHVSFSRNGNQAFRPFVFQSVFDFDTWRVIFDSWFVYLFPTLVQSSGFPFGLKSWSAVQGCLYPGLRAYSLSTVMGAWTQLALFGYN